MKRKEKNSTSVSSLGPASSGDNLDPAVRSWIDNCIVPNLVTEYLASLQGEKRLDASALADYFAPLKTWLDEQNKKNNYAVGW